MSRLPDIQPPPNGDILVPVKDGGQWRTLHVRPADEKDAWWRGIMRRKRRRPRLLGTWQAASSENSTGTSAQNQDALLSANRALDIHAAAVFQVGVAVFVGAVAIGAQAPGHLGEAIILGGAVLLAIGCYAALIMAPETKPPTQTTVETKRRQIQVMVGIFVLALLIVTVVIFLTFDFKSILH